MKYLITDLQRIEIMTLITLSIIDKSLKMHKINVKMHKSMERIIKLLKLNKKKTIKIHLQI